ncbi:rhodanese-like domain-containing protein [Corynebacterium sp. ES2775-CONJ]|uniref:rhodanese-like domain-containing protein n=1 Tax=Corynebacterium sp. ES2775-CONJ TaxID=2974029 RepID=UPI00216A76F1|nr:rhodanese-like domain-containing protein [Corynebacterium sp. ES2775-CONJ]MCS4490235.1 rhodanese-like domain-containing protein [Corynebacterium sp. ES2775-CONJ]
MREITVREVPQNCQLIDVREADEFAEVRARGAVNIPMSAIKERCEEIDKTSEVYVICKAGGRSARVGAFLEAQRFDVINIAGGTDAWLAAGLDTAS